MATLAPSAARRLAIAAPMPREPPVTSATLPASSLSCLLLMFCPFLVCGCCLSGRLWKTCSEHRSFTLRLFFGRFVLNDIPVLDQKAVLDANNVCSDPIRRLAMPGKPPVDDDEIALGDNDVVFILQRWRDAFDEIKQAVATRLYMSTML